MPAWNWLGLVWLVGGMAGAACDQIHVRFGVLWYPVAQLWGQPWWVMPNFGLGAIAIALLSQPLVRMSAARRPKEPDDRDILLAGAWFLVAYVASGVWQAHPRALLAGYVITWLARVLPRWDRQALLLHGLGLAAGGTTYEALLTQLDTFHYRQSALAGVAIWLPGIYLHGSPLALQLARRLRARLWPHTTPTA